MGKCEALKIARNIFDDNHDPEEKINALQEISEQEAFRTVTKEQLIAILRWMLEDYL